MKLSESEEASRVRARCLAQGATAAISRFPPPAAQPIPVGVAAEFHADNCRLWNPAVAHVVVQARELVYMGRGFGAVQARRQAWLDWEAARLCSGDRKDLGELLELAYDAMEEPT